MPYVTADRSLPRSLDVQISLSRPQAETRTDLSIMAVALEDLGFLPDSNRIRFYSTIEAVENDFAPGTEAHFAASAFFAQTPRAQTLALGEVFLNPLSAELSAAELTAAELAAVIAIADGEMDISYDIGAGTVLESLSGMDFTSDVTLANVAATIDAATTAALSCAVRTLPGGTELLSITTTATGDGVVILHPIDPAGVGTYVGDLLNMSAAEGGLVLNGYTPTGIADELSSILNAANNSGQFIYGWALGTTLRDATIQEDAAAWILPRTGILTLVSNDPLATSPSYQLDIGPIVAATGNRRVVVIYHDNAQRYPDVSILAYMLHVNYRLLDSTVTAKFKELPGIETVQLTETEWSVLQEKGYNTYTAIGNDARTFRDGDTSGTAGWYMDTVINLDNFVEDLSVNVYNVFLRNKKIPYTSRGVALLVDACRDTGNQYTYNGTFADREVTDSSSKSGVSITAAVQIIPTPINQMSVADRADRIGPPIAMIVQEAGAIHSVAIAVEIVS